MKDIVKKLICGDWVTENELETFLRGWKFSDKSFVRNLHDSFSHAHEILSHPEWGWQISYSPWWVYDRRSNSGRFRLTLEEVCCLCSEFGWDLLSPGVLHYESIIAEMNG